MSPRAGSPTSSPTSAANTAFHAYPDPGYRASHALVDAYDHLSLPDLMSTGPVHATSRSASILLDDHRQLVDAYERGDLPAAKDVITAHNERAKATQRAGIERAGGQL